MVSTKRKPTHEGVSNGHVGLFSRNRSIVNTALVEQIEEQLNFRGKNDKTLSAHIGRVNKLLVEVLNDREINFGTLKAIDDLITSNKARMTDNAFLGLTSTLASGWARIYLQKGNDKYTFASLKNFNRKLEQFSYATKELYEDLKNRIVKLLEDYPELYPGHFYEMHFKLLECLKTVEYWRDKEHAEQEQAELLEYEARVTVKRDLIKFDFWGQTPQQYLENHDESNGLTRTGHFPEAELRRLIEGSRSKETIARIATCTIDNDYLNNLLKELRRLEDIPISWNAPKYGKPPFNQEQFANVAIQVVSGLLHNPIFTDDMSDQAKAILLSGDKSSAGVVAVLTDLEIISPEDVWEYFIKPNIDESKIIPSEKLDPQLIVEIIAVHWPQTKLIAERLSDLTPEPAGISVAR